MRAHKKYSRNTERRYGTVNVMCKQGQHYAICTQGNEIRMNL